MKTALNFSLCIAPVHDITEISVTEARNAKHQSSKINSSLIKFN